ncbi:hypothetical protein POVWA2_051380 [Plasmodium ovale wallikeri]|uniref:Uncharacterized protein n=1 Tax=Plasmodium ovale wallikeri TaxID=864142 RepID=A0A1A8ZQQ7_PLAOA|nr:hypothetical protein POVWA1_013810 [Plasmodium ovale wallikeri]SBT46162.1 hypothetical protein POVWA2_051380 [Plasmodium ovale wallikeri]
MPLLDNLHDYLVWTPCDENVGHDMRALKAEVNHFPLPFSGIIGEWRLHDKRLLPKSRGGSKVNTHLHCHGAEMIGFTSSPLKLPSRE